MKTQVVDQRPGTGENLDRPPRRASFENMDIEPDPDGDGRPVSVPGQAVWFVVELGGVGTFSGLDVEYLDQFLPMARHRDETAGQVEPNGERLTGHGDCAWGSSGF